MVAVDGGLVSSLSSLPSPSSFSLLTGDPEEDGKDVTQGQTSLEARDPSLGKHGEKRERGLAYFVSPKAKHESIDCRLPKEGAREGMD